MQKVALGRSTLTRIRSHEVTEVSWEGVLQKLGIPYDIVNPYEYDFLDKIDAYNAFIWHYENYSNADVMEAQNIINMVEKKGLKVFPNNNTGWHFDDKIAESYALSTVGAPTPKNWMFYDLEPCLLWLKNEAKYPLIAKLRRGSGSNNVKLLKNNKEAAAYARKMFSKGFSPAQSLIYKTYSKVQSTRNMKMLIERAKKVPDFLKARKYGKGLPREKGYCYFQEFIPNAGYDMKVVVVGDKCSYLVRKTRKGSYKASGGGELYYDNKVMNENIIRSAFDTADKLGMQCVGFDYVVDKKTGQGLIIEMCYGFDFQAIYDCGGYWDRDLVWHKEAMNVPLEVIKNMSLS